MTESLTPILEEALPPKSESRSFGWMAVALLTIATVGFAVGTGVVWTRPTPIWIRGVVTAGGSLALLALGYLLSRPERKSPSASQAASPLSTTSEEFSFLGDLFASWAPFLKEIEGAPLLPDGLTLSYSDPYIEVYQAGKRVAYFGEDGKGEWQEPILDILWNRRDAVSYSLDPNHHEHFMAEVVEHAKRLPSHLHFRVKESTLYVDTFEVRLDPFCFQRGGIIYLYDPYADGKWLASVPISVSLRKELTAALQHLVLDLEE